MGAVTVRGLYKTIPPRNGPFASLCRRSGTELCGRTWDSGRACRSIPYGTCHQGVAPCLADVIRTRTFTGVYGHFVTTTLPPCILMTIFLCATLLYIPNFYSILRSFCIPGTKGRSEGEDRHEHRGTRADVRRVRRKAWQQREKVDGCQRRTLWNVSMMRMLWPYVMAL